MKTHAVAILLTEAVTHDTKRFIVEKPEDYRFTPGQATTVSIDQEGWRDKKRPFTFTSHNRDGVLEFIIKRYPEHDGVTQKLHQLKPGDRLLLEQPWGAITYKGRGVFIAGGAGITPFIAIFRELHAKGALEGNTLMFSNKAKKDIILENELLGYFGDNVIFTLTQENVNGYGYRGERINKAFLSDFSNSLTKLDSYVYLCGPEAMVKELSATLRELGVKEERIVTEDL